MFHRGDVFYIGAGTDQHRQGQLCRPISPRGRRATKKSSIPGFFGMAVQQPINRADSLWTLPRAPGSRTLDVDLLNGIHLYSGTSLGIISTPQIAQVCIRRSQVARATLRKNKIKTPIRGSGALQLPPTAEPGPAGGHQLRGPKVGDLGR